MASRTLAQRPKRRSKVSDKQLDKILKDFENQPAHLTEDQVYAFEEHFTKEWGFTRRAGLGFLGRSGKELIKCTEEADFEFAVEIERMAQSLEEYEARLTDFAHFMGKSATRLRLSLCWREDCAAVTAEAKKRLADGPIVPNVATAGTA